MAILVTLLGILWLSHSLSASVDPALVAFKRLSLAFLIGALMIQLGES